MYEYPLTIAKICYVLIVLTYFSILDIKYRDIPDKHVWTSLIGAITLFLLSIPSDINYGITMFAIYILISMLLGPVLFYGLYKANMIGGADVIVATEISLLFPLPSIYKYTLLAKESIIPIYFPPILPILLYTNLLIAIFVPFNILYNLLKYKNIYHSINANTITKIILLAIAKPVKARDYLSLKHRYLLEEFKITRNGVKRIIRTTFNINEEYTDHQKLIRKLINEGLLNPDDYVIITYGIPYIVPILFGTILFMVFGDLVIQYLFSILG